MINIGRIVFLPPMLEVVIVAGEVKINIVSLHRWQDLLSHRPVPTVTTPRVARIVAEDNLPLVVASFGKLAFQKLFHGFSVVLVVVNGDGVN